MHTLDQRRHDRHLVQIPGILRLPEVRGATYLITVLDVSKSGIRVSCPRRLPQGSRVEVKVNNSTIFGVARYTREVADMLHLGIEADALETAGKRIEGDDLDLTVLSPRANPNPNRPATVAPGAMAPPVAHPDPPHAHISQRLA